MIIALDLPCSAPAAWAALTDQRHISSWWGDYVQLDATPDGRLVERWTDGTGRTVLTVGRITRIEDDRLLELAWSDDDWPAETTVSVQLSPAPDGGTRLTLEHSGWNRFAPDRARQLLQAHADGWAHHMRSLRRYLAAAGGPP